MTDAEIADMAKRWEKGAQLETRYLHGDDGDWEKVLPFKQINAPSALDFLTDSIAHNNKYRIADDDAEDETLIGQIKDLMDSVGASEDHEDVLKALRDGMSEATADAVHTLIVNAHAASVVTTATTQVGGTHYQKGDIDLIEFAQRVKLDAMQFTIMRYVWRWRDKNGVEDLRKARDYLDRVIEFAERKA